MDTQWIIFASVLIINSMAAMVIVVLLARKPPSPGIHSMIYLLTGLSIWSFSYAMITLFPTLSAKHFWLKLENIGIVSVPVLWFFFTFKYTRLDRWLTRKPVKLVFWVIPLVTLILLFSGQWFHLYYTATQVASDTGGPLIISRGPWYMVQLGQSYVLNLAGIGVLLWSFVKSRHMYRNRLLLLIGTVLIPFVFNVIYQLFPEILPLFSVPIDLTPLVFNLTAVLLATNIFGLHLFDLVPIARDTVMEHIPEMVFVVDSSDRLVDANSMAQKWLGKSIDEISGQDPMVVFHEWPQLLKRFFFIEFTREEIQIPGDPEHTLELVITPIYNRFNKLEGRVIVAHDMTDRKKLENDLKNRLSEIDSLRAKLQEQAIRDPLTGAFNRRFFAESLDKEVARAVRDKLPFSIMIMDVDHFKEFNDTYGHKCGDVVLQSLAKFLNENTRRGDIVCRYGGEEFVILMPDASVESAYERAESFRAGFENITLEYEGRKLHCTFSVGIASYPLHTTNGETLLMMADRALYQSKTNGRNIVTIYSP